MSDDSDEDEISPSTGRRKNKRGCCLTTWMKLDELILRDLLIYKYSRNKRRLQKAFFEAYDQDGKELEKIFNLAGDDANEKSNENHSNAIMRQMTLLKKKRTSLKNKEATTPLT